MLQTVIDTFLRTVFAFVMLFAFTKIMGRKIISKMTIFDFIVSITLGSVTANLALGPQASALSAATVLIALTLLLAMTDYGHIKSFSFRKFVDSEPVVVIKNGKIIDENLRKLRYSIADITMQLRKKNIFDMGDVEFAIIEPDGIISVLKKSQKRAITAADLGIPTKYDGLTTEIIYDGVVMSENLIATNLNEMWLKSELAKRGIKDVRDVFYAGLDTAGNLYISQRYKLPEREGQYGIE